MIEVKWICIFMAVVVATAMGALAVELHGETEQMRACVAAGKSWVDNPRIFGVQMECR